MPAVYLDQRCIRRNFSRAARRYAQHDSLQRQLQALLLERLEFYPHPPSTVLDVGAGPGHGSALLKKHYPQTQLIALDAAVPMLRQAQRHSRWRKPLLCVAGDATALPLPDHSIDIVHSSLCFHWIDRLGPLFHECARVLKPGGFLLFSMLGQATLHELRTAWADVDTYSHVSRFLDMHAIGDALIAAGLRDPVLEVERYTSHYDNPLALLKELQASGGTHAELARRRTLTGKRRYQGMLAAYESYRRDRGVPATWEVIIAHAWAPAPGQPRHDQEGDIAQFPLSALKGSRIAR